MTRAIARRKKESLLNKRVLFALALLTLALVALAGCAPVPASPTAAPTSAAATETPAPPTAEAVPLTVEPVSITPDARPTVPAPVEGQRPLAEVPAADRNDRFSGPAASYAMSDTVYIATIVTDKGNIVAELYQDTPEGQNNFVTLALNGFYDGLTFHRVEPGFVIQGGDPLGQGNGGPGYTIPAEITHNHPRGALAWARTGDEINPERRSSGSQFYITLDETQFLDGAYSVFGYVIEGMDVADQIAVGDKITRIDIAAGEKSALPTPAPTPTPFAPTTQEGRPLATVPVAEREAYFNAAPEMVIDVTKTYEAVIESDKGKIVIELDPAAAPETVNNFFVLAGLGFYDNMPVAHVEPETYIVLGSPGGQPGSDAGYALPIEGPQPSAIITSTVAMYPVQGASPEEFLASGSQFFIAFSSVPESATPLNIFGKVTEGMEVAQQMAIGDIIKTITVTEK
jgi:cyclophilin family peptidyl-prolyl cis-trans isomerase